MATKIKQVSLQEINGGMLYDKDPRRIPNKAFLNLINAEYNKRGKLIKTKGSTNLVQTYNGPVKDIKKIYNTSLSAVGYLIAENQTRFVSSMEASPTQNQAFSNNNGRFLKSPSGRYYYLSDTNVGNRYLKKWYYSAPVGIDANAGIEEFDVSGLLVMQDLVPVLINQKDASNDDTSLIVSSTAMDVWIRLPHATISGGGNCTTIHFPVKADTVTSATVTVQVLDDMSNVLASGTVTFTHDDPRISVTLNTPLDIFGATLDQIGIRVSCDSGTITLHRGKVFFLDGRDLNGSVTAGSLYSDREPVMGFTMDKTTPAAGEYQYSGIIENLEGYTSNYGDITKITKADTGAYYLTLSGLYDAVVARSDASLVSKVILGRTMAGGGTFYRLWELAYTSITAYKGDTATTPWVQVGSEYFVPPGKILDLTPDASLSATPLPTDHTSPLSLQPLNHSLFGFKNRAWMLVRIADAGGTISTFLRWSEIDIYDYWDPLNELGIPDDLIECKVLRDDMLLAWSRTKTYLIMPSGTTFDWLKIADVGIGSSSMTASIGTTDASRFSCATNEAIFWINERGLYKFDGTTVTHSPTSLQNLSLILEALEANALLINVEKDWAIWLCWDYKILVLDLLNQAFTSQLRSKTITCAEEIGTAFYLGFSGGVAQRSTDWVDAGTTLTSTIKTKRFAPDDLKRIQMYYFGMTYRVQTSGTLTLVFEFSTGKTVTKTIAMSVGDHDLHSAYLEVYGEGEWFQVTMTHNENVDFEIIDYTLGATPADLVFMEPN